ncbi:hypothetical protein LBMAG18_08340 [Alphaproteobacteria bacterium]|nr:hypothetical protein LBMAG18_08340 [Alphaproteobacteria bacterium]
MRPKINKSEFLEDDNSSVDSETEVEELIIDGDNKYKTTQKIRERISDRQKSHKLDPVSGDKYYREYEFPQPEGEKYIVLYRGVRYANGFFSDKSRRKAAHFVEQNGRDVFSGAIFRNAGLEVKAIGDYVAEDLSQEDKQRLLDQSPKTKDFLEFLYKRTDLRPKINSGYVYGSLLLALIQINTNLYNKVDDYVDELRGFLSKKKQKFGITDEEEETLLKAFKDFKEEAEIQRPDRKTIISTSVRNKVGIQYALPFIEDGLVKGFDPEYDNLGKPKHRHGGEVEILFIPQSVYIAETNKMGKMSSEADRKHIYEKGDGDVLPEFTDLHLNRTRRILQPDTRIMEQFEVAFFNKIDGKYFIDTFPIYYPNFSKDFDQNYHPSQYGIKTAKKFNDLKTKLTSADTYITGIQDLTEILQGHYESKVGEMLYNILNSREGQVLSAGTPMVDANGEIKTQRYLRDATIHSRFDQIQEPKYEKKEHADMGANISVNTSPAKNPKPLTVNAAAKKSGYYLDHE